STANKQEKLQLAWATTEIATAKTNLEKAVRSLARKADVEGIGAVEQAQRALKPACASLALEPPQRPLSRMASASANRRIARFGGSRLDGWRADAWAFDCAAQRWYEKRPATAPAPRGGHALVYLPKSKKILLFGGYTYTSDTDYCG